MRGKGETGLLRSVRENLEEFIYQKIKLRQPTRIFIFSHIDLDAHFVPAA